MNKAKQQAIGTMAALLLAALFLLAGGAWALPAPKRPAEGVPADWWAQAQAEIRGLEYRPKAVPEAGAEGAVHTVRAPNRAHNFRLNFTPEGVRVTPRTATGPDWSWGLQLTGIGRAGDLRRPEAARLRVAGERVELVRGRLTEWYINDERGLEQGFTLHGPLPGSAGDELLLRLDVAGTLQPRLEQGNRAIAFAPPGGETVLRYGQLLAFDAAGRDLPVRFDLVGGGVEIAVATTGARYPIVIDPLATSVTWMATGDREGAYFGTSVATAGDVNGDGYDDVIVGAPGYSNGQSGEGAVFVYYGSSSGLKDKHDWMVESNQVNAAFGKSVATAGDVNGDGFDDIIIGAPGYADGQANEGAAFVYYGSGGGLSTSANWQIKSNQSGASLGWSVATAGDVNGDGYADVIVGAPWYGNGQVNEGAAFVYHGSSTGLSRVPPTVMSDPVPQPDWRAESNQEESFFGISLATAGDVDNDGYADVIIGADFYDHGQQNEGAVFLYHGSSAGLSTAPPNVSEPAPKPNWFAESNQEYSYFGGSVATAGDVNKDGFDDVIIGASWYDLDENFECGAAFVYHGSASGLSTASSLPPEPTPRPDWRKVSDQESSYFGVSVSTAGDVNADGYADVIVGAVDYSNGKTDEGAAFVYHGSASGLQTTVGWMGDGNQETSSFGSAVAEAGDINKDGLADVIIGAPFYDWNGIANSGAVFLNRSGPDGSFYLSPNPTGGATTIYLD